MSVSPDPVKAVYELREAAVEHGKALAAAEADAATPATIDGVIETKLQLEKKTAAALDECSDNADEAAKEALEEAGDIPPALSA